jgi:tetratricopeptide (TPR) repeat protein
MIAALMWLSPPPSLASIPLTADPLPQPSAQQLKALSQLGIRVPPSSFQRSLKPEEESMKTKISRVMALMKEAEEASDAFDWHSALRCYSDIVNKYSDLALSERARISRALVLYQVGRPDEALLQLEDEEVALRGSAEVSAALAVVAYNLGRIDQAEQQWTVATEFDGRYENPEWVASQRSWPPRMIQALQRFLALS